MLSLKNHAEDITQKFKVSRHSKLKIIKLLTNIYYLRLGEFVVMVRKLEVKSTCMDIHGSTYYTAGHHRAFYVPAWPTLRSEKHMYVKVKGKKVKVYKHKQALTITEQQKYTSSNMNRKTIFLQFISTKSFIFEKQNI